MKISLAVPFDHVTQSPVLPVDKDGMPTWRSWGRKSQPMGDSILIELEAADLIIVPLKTAPKVAWLEDFAPPKVAPVPIGMTVEPEKELDLVEMENALDEAVDVEPEKQADAEVVKEYLIAKTGAKSSDLAKQSWEKPEDIIGNVVKAHGGTLGNYRNSGLG